MLELLRTFAALSMMAGIVTSLLPDGGLRRTAGMLIGLLMLLCWAEGLTALLHLPEELPTPASVFTPTAGSLDASASAAQAMLAARWEVLP